MKKLAQNCWQQLNHRELEVEEGKVICTPAEDTITYMKQKIENDSRRAS